MKSSNIGGQAVLEGIMMKHREEYAVAVRKPDGQIEVSRKTATPGIAGRVGALARDPFIRERHLQLCRFPCAGHEDPHLLRQLL